MGFLSCYRFVIVKKAIFDSIFCIFFGPLVGTVTVALIVSIFKMAGGGGFDLSGQVPRFFLYGYMFGAPPALVGGFLFSLRMQGSLASLTRKRFTILGGLYGAIATGVYYIGLCAILFFIYYDEAIGYMTSQEVKLG